MNKFFFILIIITCNFLCIAAMNNEEQKKILITTARKLLLLKKASLRGDSASKAAYKDFFSSCKDAEFQINSEPSKKKLDALELYDHPTKKIKNRDMLSKNIDTLNEVIVLCNRGYIKEQKSTRCLLY